MKTLKPTLFFILSIAFAISQAQIVHVPGDYSTIQEGIDAAQFFGDTVLVEQGTYYENISFSGKLITVASHFIISGDSSDLYNTIIDGSQPSNPDEGSVVYFRNDEDSTSVLCGFTITGGTGTLVPADDIRAGGGIFVENCNPKIIHNHIIENHVSTNLKASGGGIAVGDATNNDGLTIIRHNIISNNSVEGNVLAEGGGLSLYSNGIIEHNVITHNEISAEESVVGGGVRCVGVLEVRYILFNENIISYNKVNSGSMTILGGAGGMQAYNCWGYISNNTIQSNEIYGEIGSLAGGLHFGFCGVFMIVENNMITDNSANYEEGGGIGGGVVMFTSNCQLINNVIARNYAADGSGIEINQNQDGPAQFINNTIANNEGDGVGGAIYIKNGDAVVLNTILWDNGSAGEEIVLEANGNIEVAYSDVLGGWPGLENIDEDPLFEDDSYHLNCSGPSPCIDAGLDEFNFGTVYCYAPDHDLEGEERPLDVTYDIGADEAKICVAISEMPSTIEANLTAYPNPCSGAVNIQYSIYNIQYTKVELYSADGVRVRTLKQGIFPAGKQEQTFDISDLPDGMYFVRLQAGERIETAKVILLK